MILSKDEKVNIAAFDAWCQKNNLVFVEIRNNLCMPIPTDNSPENLNILLDVIENLFNARDRIFKSTGNELTARYMLPIQRVFHKTRIRGFEVYTIEDFRKSLK